MLTILNKANCGTALGNTGACDCPLSIQTLTGFILAPRSFRATASQLASVPLLIAALQAATLADRSGRIYPVKIVGVPTDNSEAPTTETLPNGVKVVVREGAFDITTQADNNSLSFARELRKFNGVKFGAFVYDQAGNLYGIRDGDTYAPISLFTNFTDYKLPTASNIAQVNTELVWDKVTFLSKYAAVQVGAGLLDVVVGLQNIRLGAATRVAGVITLTATIEGCGESFGIHYPTSMTGASSTALINWVVTDDVTGKNIPITAIAFDPTTENFTITVDTTSANYVPGNKLDVNLVSANLLNTNGIISMESTGKVVTAS